MDLKQIIETTQDFYKNISEEFSNTRQFAWKGWGSIFEKISLPENAEILDLGCGNGRFYEFLQNQYKHFKYTGLDIDNGLLNIARNKYPDATFKKLDIIQNLQDIEGKYDLVVGFGITHHIPIEEFRKRWFNNIAKLLKKDGLLVLSFWDFLNKKSLIKIEDLEENDYWLGWGDKKIKRYCHYYTPAEFAKIDEIFRDNNLSLFEVVKNEEDDNKYKVYKKDI